MGREGREAGGGKVAEQIGGAENPLIELKIPQLPFPCFSNKLIPVSRFSRIHETNFDAFTARILFNFAYGSRVRTFKKCISA